MKKYYIAILTVLCIAIIGLSIINNTSFNKNIQKKDSIESRRDSFLFQNTFILDSIYFYYKSNYSMIQRYKANKDNSEKILKPLKQTIHKNK